jgi:hypothetical protein
MVRASDLSATDRSCAAFVSIRDPIRTLSMMDAADSPADEGLNVSGSFSVREVAASNHRGSRGIPRIPPRRGSSFGVDPRQPIVQPPIRIFALRQRDDLGGGDGVTLIVEPLHNLPQAVLILTCGEIA